jgi:hypothetical protein
MLGFISKYWRATQRATDISTLWPACKKHAKDMDNAKSAFYMHASNDEAWTKDYTEDELITFVNKLK